MRFTKPSSPAKALVAILALATPVALGALATSSASATPPPPVTWTVLVGNQSSNMAIQGERFLPGDLTIDQGDTVTWQANSAEPHTVTFFADGVQTGQIPAFSPGDPTQATAQGGDTFAPSTYFNSGVLSTVSIPLLPFGTVSSYSLTFPSDLTVGTYTYYCLVHGNMMRGEIHVQPAGSAYPASQSDINADASFMASAILADGRAELAAIKAKATHRKVIMGADDGIAMVGRFVHGRVVIHKGDTVTWVNNMSMGAPHTVTVGAPHAGPGVLAPYGHPSAYKTGDLSSGAVGPHGRFSVTFKRVGKVHYYCLFHDELGMKGVVVVKP